MYVADYGGAPRAPTEVCVCVHVYGDLQGPAESQGRKFALPSWETNLHLQVFPRIRDLWPVEIVYHRLLRPPSPE